MQSKESMPILTKERNLVTFWEEAVEHIVKGKVTYDKVLYARVITPGDKGDVVHEIEREYPEDAPNPIYGSMKRNETAYNRFAEYLERWRLQRDKLVVDGTPIDAWAQVDVRMAAHLKSLGIFSVQALATLGDSGIAKVGMGGRALVEKAKTFVAQSENSAHALEVEERNRKLTEQLEAMQAQITDLAEAMEALPPEGKAQVQETLKRKRGRPPKVQQVA